jgi:hypothetical protein
VPKLNRFPLLGLWAEEAARRLGYRRDEAESLGHAYAVLYAIRAARRPKPPATAEEVAWKAQRHAAAEHLRFCGDELEVTHDAEGRLHGRVGGDRPQTPATYRTSVRAKFPPGYYEWLRRAFRDLLRRHPPRALKGRLVYNTYDTWKKACGVGRSVDLDRLLDWCEQRTPAPARMK